jgi:hypothetical protein
MHLNQRKSLISTRFPARRACALACRRDERARGHAFDQLFGMGNESID